MIVGALGEIVFMTSSNIIRTVQDVSWGGAARIATHERHLGNALTEFTGLDPDSISLKITLSKYFGVDPMEDIKTLLGYERNGTAVSFVLGDHIYGKYRWLIEKHTVTMKDYDKDGNLTTAEVSVSLKEYVMG